MSASDDADLLYGFLYPGEKRRKVSAASVGRRLAKYVDNPVSKGGRTLVLRRRRDPHTKKWWYRVEELLPAPPRRQLSGGGFAEGAGVAEVVSLKFSGDVNFLCVYTPGKSGASG
jgi:hypothetical protein